MPLTDIEDIVAYLKEYHGRQIENTQALASLLYGLMGVRAEVVTAVKGVAPAAPQTVIPNMNWLTGCALPTHEVDAAGKPLGLTDGVTTQLRKMVRDISSKVPTSTTGLTALAAGANTYTYTVPNYANTVGLGGNRVLDVVGSNPDAASRTYVTYITTSADVVVANLQSCQVAPSGYSSMRAAQIAAIASIHPTWDGNAIPVPSAYKIVIANAGMTGSNNMNRAVFYQVI